MVPVPPLLAWTLGALGAAYVVKLLAKQWRRANADLDRRKDTPIAEPKPEPKPEAVPTLRRDPVTGIYRP